MVQAQVDEVKGIMDRNIQDMIERGEKLDDLEKKTSKLAFDGVIGQGGLFILFVCSSDHGRSTSIQQKHRNCEKEALVEEY